MFVLRQNKVSSNKERWINILPMKGTLEDIYMGEVNKVDEENILRSTRLIRFQDQTYLLTSAYNKLTKKWHDYCLEKDTLINCRPPLLKKHIKKFYTKLHKETKSKRR